MMHLILNGVCSSSDFGENSELEFSLLDFMVAQGWVINAKAVYWVSRECEAEFIGFLKDTVEERLKHVYSGVHERFAFHN